jgi:Na+/H+-dicarboxylate symporter/ABC-type amino acid transport substrate-binding protein
LNLASWVLVGGAAGIAAGVLFGDACAMLRPIGFAYVGLLEAAVYPYLICSLLHGLGSLQPAKAWRLFKCGWPFYVATWGVTFAALIALAQAIPRVEPAIIDATLASKQSGGSLLGLLIPTDLFTALSQNYVPAVVIFCIFYGVAMQTLEDKTSILSVLNAIRLASLRFWNWIVRLAPVGVFALFAVTAGTTSLAGLVNMSLYLGLFLLGTFLLAFWVLPALISAMAPVGHREVLHDLRAAVAISAVTTLSVAALPFITDATRKLADRCGIADAERDDVIRTNLSVAYPLGQLGNFFIYLFVVFAAYYYKAPIDATNAALLPVMTLLSGFGSPTSAVNAVNFLSAWLPLPPAAPELYVELSTITRYGQVIVSVMAFAFLSVLVTLAYYGKLQIRLERLVLALLLPAVAFGGLAWIGRHAGVSFGRTVTPYGTFTLDAPVTRGVQATVYWTAAEYDRSADAAIASAASGTTTSHIQRTGTLRVGYNPSIVPFCYVNAAGELVGFDVAYAYDLARALNVRLVFIPFAWPHLRRDLEAGRFDIAMSGIYATTDRLSELSGSEPYYQSPLALFMPADRADRFRTREQILAMPSLRIGVFDDPVLRPVLARVLPNAEIVVVPDYRTLPDFAKVDAAIWTLEQAGALARANAGITAVVPKDLGSPFFFTYLMPPGSQEMVHFVNYWLELRKASGFRAREMSYWIEGRPRDTTERRWSVVRDVLGWGRHQ